MRGWHNGRMTWQIRTTGMAAALALLAWGLAPGAARAAAITPPPAITPPGMTSQWVNNGPGDQVDPHISGDLVAYTDISGLGSGQIRYQHLAAAGSAAAIPTNAGIDILPDVRGSTIVYTHITGSGQAILSFDTSTSGPPTELAPQPNPLREHSGIGDSTIVWDDFGFSAAEAEIVAYDRATATTTRLTNDSLQDVNPAVSADGSVITWTKCDSSGVCNIWDATRTGPGAWAVHQLTTDGLDELPDTNGSVVVYDATRNGEQDVYWQPVGGGPETQLAFPGADRHPTVSGNLITFEHRSSGANANYDIYTYDMLNGTLYRLTDTPQDEALNDVWSDPATGATRAVWSLSNGSTGFDVYAASFVVPPPDAPITITHIGALANKHGQAAAGVTFSDADPQGNLSQYSGTIDWGDGSAAMPAAIVRNPFSSGFAAGGAHLYAVRGTYTVTITIHDVGGAMDSGSTTVVVR